MANSNDKKIGQISCEKEDTCLELSSPHCSGNCSKDPISCLNFVKKKRRWGSSHRVFSKGNKLHTQNVMHLKLQCSSVAQARSNINLLRSL